MVSSSPADSSLYSSTSSPRVLGSTTTLLLVATITFVMRIYSRVRLYRNPGWDDWLMSVAMAFSVIEWAFTLAEQIRTGGRHMMLIEPDDMMVAMKLSFVSLFFWAWAITLIKSSVCVLLLRIKNTPAWKWGIGIMISLQLAAAIATTTTLLLQCRPIAANWNVKIPNAKCWSVTTTGYVVYPVASVIIATDVACSLLPLAFVTQVRRPFREKAILVFIMGLGLFASALGIAKIFAVAAIKNSGDPLWQNVNASLLAYCEQDIGIIAANIPCTKRLLEKIFVRLGGQLSNITGKRRDTDQRNQFTGGSSNIMYLAMAPPNGNRRKRSLQVSDEELVSTQSAGSPAG